MATYTRSVAALSFVLCAAGSALAANEYTFVYNGASGEPRHLQVFQTVFGGTWSGANSRNFNDPDVKAFFGPSATNMFLTLSNGSITATRVQDRGGGSPLRLDGANFGSANDQQWRDGTVGFSAQVEFASDTSTFGWINRDNVNGGPTGTINTLLNPASTGSGNFFLNSSLFEWALRNNTQGYAFSSNELLNDPALGGGGTPADVDHMVTYRLTGFADGLTRWMLFFEDRTSYDFDYNDAVILLTVGRAIPLPQAGAMGLAGLGLLAARRRRQA